MFLKVIRIFCKAYLSRIDEDQVVPYNSALQKLTEKTFVYIALCKSQGSWMELSNKITIRIHKPDKRCHRRVSSSLKYQPTPWQKKIADNAHSFWFTIVFRSASTFSNQSKYVNGLLQTLSFRSKHCFPNRFNFYLVAIFTKCHKN